MRIVNEVPLFKAWAGKPSLLSIRGGQILLSVSFHVSIEALRLKGSKKPKKLTWVIIKMLSGLKFSLIYCKSLLWDQKK